MSNGPLAPTLGLISEGYPLIQQHHLSYVGGFRVPAVANPYTGANQAYNSGGHGLAYWPENDSLCMAGVEYVGGPVPVKTDLFGEFSIVANPVSGVANVSDLPIATNRQSPRDVFAGKFRTMDGDNVNDVRFGGCTFLGTGSTGLMVISAWTFYDNFNPPQTKTHFICELGAAGKNFLTLSQSPNLVHGPYQITDGFKYHIPPAVQGEVDERIGGFCAGYTCPIPPAMQPHFGNNTHLAGHGGAVSVLTRTSAGAACVVYSPSAINFSVAPLPSTVPDTNGKLIMGYPAGGTGALNHPTMGTWGIARPNPFVRYDGTQSHRAMLFPDGTRSILFIGWESLNEFCYGAPTKDPKVHRFNYNPSNPKSIYCYDPRGGGGTGPSNLYTWGMVWAYDAVDFISIYRNRGTTLQPWEIKPYSCWNFRVPLCEKIGDTSFPPTVGVPGSGGTEQGVDLGHYEMSGAAWDPVRRRIYVSTNLNEPPNYQKPVIHAFQLTI